MEDSQPEPHRRSAALQTGSSSNIRIWSIVVDRGASGGLPEQAR